MAGKIDIQDIALSAASASISTSAESLTGCGEPLPECEGSEPAISAFAERANKLDSLIAHYRTLLMSDASAIRVALDFHIEADTTLAAQLGGKII